MEAAEHAGEHHPLDVRVGEMYSSPEAGSY